MKKIVYFIIIGCFLAILVASTSYLEYRRQEAEDRAINWANKYTELLNDSGGDTDEWFEKNAMTRTGQPEELLKIADEIGLKHIRKTNLRYGSQAEIERDTEGFAYAYYVNGDYGGNNRYITIPKNWKERGGISKLKRTLAHEYLHYIWANSAKMQSDPKLEAGLLRGYATSSDMQKRVAGYVENNNLLLTELFSFSCTEFSDEKIDEDVLNWCNKWVDRSKLDIVY